jgi:MoxR-like ATPase
MASEERELQPRRAAELLGRIEENVHRVIVGKDRVVRLAAAGLVAGGHVLLQDLPGTGKTMLARALATSVGGSFRRIQCTPDLLPSDITGSSVFNQKDLSFQFVAGPIFANFVLADEVNRATPRTQSALLEAMGEGQVTIEGVTRTLDKPFFVIATQNPTEFHGTYPLPESQLDRFLMRVVLGYPDAAHERELLRGGDRRELLTGIAPVLRAAGVLAVQRAVRKVYVADALLDYAQALIMRTRAAAELKLGLSPRAGQGLIRAAQAWSYLAGRRAVLPEDLQAVLPSVVAHRLERRDPAAGADGAEVAAEIIRAVPVP